MILCGLRDATVERRIEAACAHFDGVRVIGAHDSTSLLRGLRHSALAVVVADLKFGETDIFEILRLIRARPDGGTIGVLLAPPPADTQGVGPSRGMDSPGMDSRGNRLVPVGKPGPGHPIDYVAMARTQGVAGLLPPSFDAADLLALITPYLRRRGRRTR